MTQTVMVRGQRYAFEDAGDGPLVVFGHGLLFDRGMFGAQAAALQRRYRCVRLDWPGHGLSGFREGGWSAGDLVDDTVEFVQALGAREAVFVGLSQGAAIFTRLALAHPDMVRALVVMDATPLAAAEGARAWLMQSSAALAEGDAARCAAVFDGALDMMFSPATQRHRPEVVRAARATFAAHPRDGLALAMRVPLSYESIVARLRELAMPTLIAWGEDDAGAPLALADHYRSALPQARFAAFAGAGHSLPLERPQELTLALTEFLTSLPPR
ncbi:MAG: alpha/beta hydrolase [Proteobacteria bacterium]|nr:alpha/beta hydrolase [Pseudomonadota bacterium]